jgi:hypothetical protein
MKRHRIGDGNGERKSPKSDALAGFISLRKRLLSAGLDDVIDLEILRACSRPVEKRGRTPHAGQNLVYDRHYADLRMRGLIRWKQQTPGVSSFGDYYVLTDRGRALLTGKKES